MYQQNQEHNHSFIRTVIFSSDLIDIGLFRCRPSYPHFANTGPIHAPVIVFPRTSVQIIHSGGEAILANPNVVMFYNQHQVYHRGCVSERGDICEWFRFKPMVLLEALAMFDAAIMSRLHQPFRFTHGPSDAHNYLLQRMVVEHVLSTNTPDTLFVEETLIAVLNHVITTTHESYKTRERFSHIYTQQAHATLTQQAQFFLSSHFTTHFSLTDLATQLHCSPYHLARIFHQHTGYPIHQYQQHLRLRTALEYVSQGYEDLAALALELGYSSHSHFTQMFRKTFGFPPSRLRLAKSAQHLREISKTLIA